jgi:hypothetical protein
MTAARLSLPKIEITAAWAFTGGTPKLSFVAWAAWGLLTNWSGI